MKKDYQSLDDLLNDCSVRVKTEGGHGTGFFVAPTLILTCAHVIEDAYKKNTPITAYCNFNQKTIPVGPVGKEDVFPESYPDLALLRVDIRDHPCVLLGTEYRAFTDFYSYGYTKDHPDGESTTVECEGTLEYGGTLIKLKDGQVKPGASGSPLLNKKTGLVCGMITNTRDRNSDLGGAGAPMEVIFAKFPDLKRQNQACHLSDPHWKALLEKEVTSTLNIPSSGHSEEPVNKRVLREVMISNFSQEDLELLCSDVQHSLANDGINLQVDLDVVGGDSKPARVLNLIKYLDRRGHLSYLVEEVRRQRPILTF